MSNKIQKKLQQESDLLKKRSDLIQKKSEKVVAENDKLTEQVSYKLFGFECYNLVIRWIVCEPN